jgi:hypothetical protein
MLKKLITGVLLILFLFNCTVSGLIWLSKIESHRASVFLQSKGDFLTTIYLTEQAWASVNKEEAREFELEGKRYDLISVTATNGFVSVRCYDDTAEKEMWNELSFGIQGDQSTNSSKKLDLKKSFEQFSEEIPEFTFCFSSHSTILFSHSIPDYAVSLSIPSPPPWLV